MSQGSAKKANVDHGLLQGLADDDHTIYLKADGSRAFTAGLVRTDIGGATNTELGLTNNQGVSLELGRADGTNATPFIDFHGGDDVDRNARIILTGNQSGLSGGTLNIQASAVQVNSVTFTAWTSYNPSWTASVTNPVIGNGTITGGYMQLGETVFVQGRILAGSTTTFGSGNYSISLPAAMGMFASNIPGGGAIWLRDNSGLDFTGMAILTTAGSTFQIRMGEGGNTLWTPTVPFTMANGDWVSWCFFYRSTA